MRTQFLEGFGHDKHVTIVRVTMDGELVYDAVHDSPDATSSWTAVANCCGWNKEGCPRAHVESTFGALDPTTNNYIIDCVPLINGEAYLAVSSTGGAPQEATIHEGDQPQGP